MSEEKEYEIPMMLVVDKTIRLKVKANSLEEAIELVNTMDEPLVFTGRKIQQEVIEDLSFELDVKELADIYPQEVKSLDKEKLLKYVQGGEK